MRMMALITLTVAVLTAGAAAAHAMTVAAPGALGAAGANFVQHVVNVCSMNGCAPVQVQRVRKHHP